MLLFIEIDNVNSYTSDTSFISSSRLTFQTPIERFSRIGRSWSACQEEYVPPFIPSLDGLNSSLRWKIFIFIWRCSYHPLSSWNNYLYNVFSWLWKRTIDCRRSETVPLIERRYLSFPLDSNQTNFYSTVIIKYLTFYQSTVQTTTFILYQTEWFHRIESIMLFTGVKFIDRIRSRMSSML